MATPEFERLAKLSNSHPLQPAPEPGASGGLRHYKRRAPRGSSDRRTAQARAQRSARLFCASTPCTRATQQRGKGTYHINAVDEVTQWEVVLATPRMCGGVARAGAGKHAAAVPVSILGFRSDNGREFINKTVARLLGKLRIEQTKSRPRKSKDNGLVETKNGAIVRKHIG